MCGRFTLTCEDREGLTAALGVPGEQLPEASTGRALERRGHRFALGSPHEARGPGTAAGEVGLGESLGEGRHARSAADQWSRGGPGKGTGVS